MKFTKEEEIVIPHLGILVTSCCNLNCRNCADLIPKRGNFHYKLEDIIQDMNKVLENVSFIQEVLVIGGETLLYPWLKEVIDFCRKQEKIGKIVITTNGTLQPTRELMMCLKENKVCVRVSGYPEHVVPNRKMILEEYRTNELEIEDLDGMQWADMGTFEKRNHTPNELHEIFKSCEMANCVTLQKDGLIFYCSRSLSAYETELYPKPVKGEYIDVRKDKNLQDSLYKFYNVPYLTTCDYCDGISCVTTKFLLAGIQILDKKVFLELLSIVDGFQNNSLLSDADIAYLKQILLDNSQYLCDKEEYLQSLYALENLLHVYDENNIYAFQVALIKLVNSITDDYGFAASDNMQFVKKNKNLCVRNQITVGSIDGKQDEDLLFDEKEVLRELRKRYVLDYAEYNRLFIETELLRLKTENVSCAVCGLSYTQYGIIKEKMPVTTVNLSVTGQDIPYSLLMALKAVEIQPEIGSLLIPMTYYQGFYDMSADDAFIHEDIIRRVNIPILNNKRNYKGVLQKKEENEALLKVYDEIFDFQRLEKLREQEMVEQLSGREYFNELFQEPKFGGLNFDFKTLSEVERWESAKKTANLNERVVTAEGYQEVLKYVKELLPRLTERGRKVVFFVPPMTKYLYAAYSDELKQNFENQIVTLLKNYRNVRLVDLSTEKTFEDNDFCDFEHLNYNGGVKLTSILSKYL